MKRVLITARVVLLSVAFLCLPAGAQAEKQGKKRGQVCC